MNVVLTVLFIPKYLTSVTPYTELLKICISSFALHLLMRYLLHFLYVLPSTTP